MGERASGWAVKLLFFGIPLGVGLFLFGGPLRRAWMASRFPDEQLRAYQSLFGGEGLGSDVATQAPARAGKVMVVRPSRHSYSAGAGATAIMAWTQVAPELRGKVLAELDPPRLDDAWYELSPDLRAESPDEVGTVVFVETFAIRDGVYVQKGDETMRPVDNAIRRDGVLKAYDWKAKRFLGAWAITGETPPDETTYFGPHHGKSGSVNDAIARMPAR